MALETMKIKLLRYYNDPQSVTDEDGNVTIIDKNAPAGTTYNFYCNETSFAKFAPIQQLGILALPGTKFYLNLSEEPIIIGATGIYELDLRNTTANLKSLRFDKQSMINIKNNPNGYLIIDMVYNGGN